MPIGQRRPLLVPSLIALLVLGVTAVYWNHEEQETRTNREIDFADAADRTTFQLEQRLSSYIQLLQSSKAFLESKEHTSPDEFRRYVQTLQLDKRPPGLSAIAVATRITTGDPIRVGFDAGDAAQTGGQISSAPIVLIEPHTGSNAKAVGVDIASNQALKVALEKAGDSGLATLAGGTALVPESALGGGKSVTFVSPLYAKLLPLETEMERRSALVGWVYVSIEVSGLVQGLRGKLDRGVYLEVFEEQVQNPPARLYRDADGPIANESPSVLRTTRTLDVAGGRWTLAFHALPTFQQKRTYDDGHWTIAVAGCALSFLAGWMAWLLLTGRERAIAFVKDMTRGLRAEQLDREAILKAIPDLLFDVGLDGRYYQYHTRQEDLLAAPPEFFLGKLISDTLPAPAAKICLEALQEAHATGYSSGRQIHLPIEGKDHWFELSIAPKETHGSEGPRFIMISRDVTERREAENHLRLIAQVYKSSHEGIFITDANNQILLANDAFTRITGYDESEVLGNSLFALSSERQNSAFHEAVWQSVKRDGSWKGEMWSRRKDSDDYLGWLSLSAVNDESGQLFQSIGIISDLSDNKAAQEHIEYLANYDTLTRLPNRKLLEDRAKLALATAKRTGSHAVLMYLNINRFQAINETLGRKAGDELLQFFAGRLTSNLQGDDTVSRHSGDEFVLLLPNTDTNGAAHIASRMLALIKEPFALADGHEISLTACIGIAVYPSNGEDFDRLSQSADGALKWAKGQGRDSFRFFNDEVQSSTREILLLESHLRRAEAMGELLLYYQPQVDAVTEEIIGAEALIRWQHPQWGMMPPARFIPVAENNGQILEIGEWVLRTAAQQVVDWQKAGLEAVPVAVNLSVRQFHQPNLCEVVQQALHACGLAPEMLELELTESVAMEDSSFTLDQIGKLHAMGLKLSIDDFGTGYSSLSYLKRYQIDKLKIDQSFVRDLDKQHADGAIVRAIIQMAHGLGFKTIAEGVETSTQLDYLRAHGCDEVQGYFFGRPVPANEFAKLLKVRRLRVVSSSS